MKKKATCKDIKKLVKILKEHEIKPDKDGLITIKIDNNWENMIREIKGIKLGDSDNVTNKE